MSEIPCAPSKRIFTEQDIATFQKSSAYGDILMFLRILEEKVRSKLIPASFNQISPVVVQLVAWLDGLIALVDKFPPQRVVQGRFGNSSFRLWLNEAETVSRLFLAESLHLIDEDVTELHPYLCDSFGNSTRIDYGTGHELNFFAFLCCLSKLELLKLDDSEQIVFLVFNRYLSLVRRLQLEYTMEPAGSRGVWGLDDFQFLPYLFGASQLVDSHIPGDSVMNTETVSQLTLNYLYFDAVNFIYKTKRGPFFEHSPILHSLSGLSDWQRVSRGLLKMYIAEVLHKHVVVQHFLFGRLLSYSPKAAAAVESTEIR